MACGVAHDVANCHIWQITWHVAWRIAKHFFKNCRLRGVLPCGFTRSGVSDLFLAFLTSPVEFSILLITKKFYVLRFVSKDLSRGHLRRSRPSHLVAMQPCLV